MTRSERKAGDGAGTSRLPFNALTERSFRYLWIGRTASAFGDAVMPVTLIFAILSVGGSASDIGVVLAVTTVARVALLVLGGALADRLPRQMMLVGSDLTLAVVQTIVGILLLTGHGSVTALLVAAVFYGAGAAVSKPAMTGLVPQTVTAGRLQQANALMGMSLSSAGVVGPALGGVIASVAEPGIAYLVDAATFGVSVVTLTLVKLPKRIPAKGGRLIQDIVHGWREMVSRPWYVAGLAAHAVWNVGYSIFLVLGPVIVTRHTGSPSSWGMVATSMACGSLVGGLFVASWRPKRPLVAGHLALLLSGLQIIVLFGPSPLPVIVAAVAVTAAGMTVLNELWVTSMQQLIPENVVSRISSYDWLISLVVAPLGYAAAGPLSEHAGTSATLSIALALSTVPVALLLMVPGIRRVRRSSDGMAMAEATDGATPGEPQDRVPVDQSASRTL
ncbi:MFS transporter [Streptomyces sp. NBC_00885]|uniref:MFS transporter n=1 Tax=Streptomyces sp. NBC_00885 TaxID=2975857 RepID=UPI0038630C24|nr:MFS transporter [Streptomyces sp. NBC_00885]